MAPFFVLEEFISYLKIEKRFSGHTVLAYNKDILQFLEFTDVRTTSDLKEINALIIRSWMVELIEGSMQNKSVNRKLSALRSFFKWLKKENHIDFNPISKIRGPKMSKRLPQFAKESELTENKIEGFFPNDFDGMRDRLIFEMLYQTGIRLNELIELKNQEVQESTIKVLGKRNKERIVPITKSIQSLIKIYRSSPEIKDKNIFYFFSLKNGKKLYPKFVYRKINFYLSKVTNLDKCSPHVLRHTFATHMLNNGAGLETLKDLLGHASLSATQVYTHNSFAQLTNIYSQAHPRGHKE